MASRLLAWIIAIRYGGAPVDVSKGLFRGIDFYDRMQLRRAIKKSIYAFYRVHGYLPSILAPKAFSEKILWAKFFSEFLVPESGNKLLTSKFIPDEVSDLVRCPRIVWHSSAPILPSNTDMVPGEYYLKANHGSGMFAKIIFPLNEDERRDLEALCEAWLNNQFGLSSGEWWYCAFQKEILIEECVVKKTNPISCNFFVSNNKIFAINLYRKTGDVDGSTWFDEGLTLLSYQSTNRSVVNIAEVGSDNIVKLKEYALKIAKGFQFMRVDFLCDGSDFFLGEVTFTPGNGLTFRPYDDDVDMGRNWEIKW